MVQWGSRRCVSDHILGRRSKSKMAPDLVSPRDARHRLGKTFHMAVPGREAMAAAGRVVGKHPLPIPPSREWFALFMLCQAGRTEEAEWGVPGLRTDRQA